jgi:hypothetical protein
MPKSFKGGRMKRKEKKEKQKKSTGLELKYVGGIYLMDH